MFNTEQLLRIERAVNAAEKIWTFEEMKDVTVGEIGEFLVLIGRRAQKRADKMDWLNEIPDVIIMMFFAGRLMGCTQEEVVAAIAIKMNKLEQKIIDNGGVLPPLANLDHG